ncbi:MAG: hypothetical protein WDN46_16300 [Methylocella sp.]
MARLAALSIFASLASFITCADAAQFSADIVSLNANGDPAGPAGKLYVSDGKAHIETPDLANGFFVVDATTNASLFVRPAKSIFMEARQTNFLTQILVPVDPDDPCRTWQAMSASAEAAGQGGQWRCDRIGEETIDGRKTTAYSAVSPLNKRITGWIDQDLKILLKSQIEGGATFELKNIAEGPQPEALFEIPASYQKFDPQRLIEIVKKSDVWVEPIR